MISTLRLIPDQENSRLRYKRNLTHYLIRLNPTPSVMEIGLKVTALSLENRILPENINKIVETQIRRDKKPVSYALVEELRVIPKEQIYDDVERLQTQFYNALKQEPLTAKIFRNIFYHKELKEIRKWFQIYYGNLDSEMRSDVLYEIAHKMHGMDIPYVKNKTVIMPNFPLEFYLLSIELYPTNKRPIRTMIDLMYYEERSVSEIPNFALA